MKQLSCDGCVSIHERVQSVDEPYSAGWDLSDEARDALSRDGGCNGSRCVEKFHVGKFGIFDVFKRSIEFVAQV